MEQEFGTDIVEIVTVMPPGYHVVTVIEDGELGGWVVLDKLDKEITHIIDSVEKLKHWEKFIKITPS